MQSWGLCLLIATCTLPCISRADSMNTQVSCYTSGQAAVSGANSCSVAGADGYANDNLQLALTKAVLSSDYTTVLLSENGVAHSSQSYRSAVPNDAAVSSSASLDLTLNTPGPARPGYIQVEIVSGLDTEWGLASLAFSVGPQRGGCYQHTSDCSLGSAPPVTSLLPLRFYDFTLGDPFSVQLAYTDSFSTAQDSTTSPITGFFELQFRFFESDQVTPVAINPEPSTWGLIAVALVGFSVYGVRRRAT